MKKYAVVVTLIALGLLLYILIGQPKADRSSPSPPSSSYSASVYQPATQPRATLNPVSSVKSTTATFVLNKNSKVFHKPSCASVKQMKESNKRTYTGSRSAVIEMGYRPCGRCSP